MIYNVAQLLKSPVGTSIGVDLDDQDRLQVSEDGVTLAGPVRGHLRLHRTNQGIFADGTVTVPVELECTRCLKHFARDITFPLREQYYPTIDVVTGVPLPTPDDELAFPIDRHHMLDTREAIRQNLLLALPISALCQEDCKGLCPKCGHDLNEGPCDCVEDETDERMTPLRDLLQQMER